MNQRPSGYEPDELPDCSTPRSLAPSSWVLNYLTIFWGLCQYRNFCEIYFFYMVFSSLKHTLNKSRFLTAQTGVFSWISLFSFLSLASLPLLQRWWPTPALWWAPAANSRLTTPSLPKTNVTNNKKRLHPCTLIHRRGENDLAAGLPQLLKPVDEMLQRRNARAMHLHDEAVRPRDVETLLHPFLHLRHV